MAAAGTDSGVETGNESNDLDDISINVNVINEMGHPVALQDCPHSSSYESGLNNFPNQSPSSDEKDVPPPPPPTSPNICSGSQCQFPGLDEFSSDSLDGMQQGTLSGCLLGGAGSGGLLGIGGGGEDCEIEDDEEEDRDRIHSEVDEMTMDRDFNEDQEQRDESGHGSYSPSPPFFSDIPHPDRDQFINAGGQFAQGVGFVYSSNSSSASMESSGLDGINHHHHNHHHHYSPISFPHSMFSSPPAPPATPTGTNQCRALVKFEFPELPRLVCEFVEPPAGLRSFLSVEPFYPADTKTSRLENSRSGGYSVLNSSPSTSDCRSLIPYEQHDLRQKVRTHTRTIRNKLYDNWSNLRREYNERRLRTAASAGSALMIQKLLDAGVDPNASDELGRTPLHIAACKGYSEIVRLLLQAGANPNQKDSVGNTPLHLSACTNHFDVVTCLLRAGTDVSTMDNNGRNPLQLAQSKLKLIMQSAKSDTEDAVRVKMEIQQIIEMMLEYLQKKGQDVEAELLNEFANRLTLSQTPQEVDDLLANLSSLSITSASGSGFGMGRSEGRSRAMTMSNPVKAPPRNPYLIPNLNPNFARPRSASFTAPSSSTNSSGASASSSHRSVLAPGILSRNRKSPTVHEEQQQLMNKLQND